MYDFFFFDPIEQYDLGLLNVCGYTIYPVYLHIFLIVFVVLWVASRLQLTIFGYFQHKLYTFIKNAFLSVCGPDRQILFPYFYYIFLFLLTSNIIGMIPWSFTLTAQISIVFFFSITSLGGVTILSIQQKGWRFFEIFKPEAPKLLEHFLIVIEFVSFLIRFVSLAVRLFANMVAGHALLKILLLFLLVIFNVTGIYAVLGSILGFIIILAVVALEILIAFLQAYVFVFLMLVYTKELL